VALPISPHDHLGGSALWGSHAAAGLDHAGVDHKGNAEDDAGK